jgi:hypothetical protein
VFHLDRIRNFLEDGDYVVILVDYYYWRQHDDVARWSLIENLALQDISNLEFHVETKSLPCRAEIIQSVSPIRLVVESRAEIRLSRIAFVSTFAIDS